MTPQTTQPALAIRRIGIALAAYQPKIAVFEEQLRTIQNQSWRDWVCVITCDSPLEPLCAAPELTPFFADSRFIWEENPIRLGHKKNFERAIQSVLARGVDAIACSDQDDIWYAEKLETCARALERAGPLSLVHSDMHVLRDGVVAPETAWTIEQRGVHNAKPEHLLIRNVVAGCAMLFDPELARRFPAIPEAAEYHDHWYALVASFHGGVHPIPTSLYAYRQHDGNEVGVSPYPGLFTLQTRLSPREVLKKCTHGWARSHALAQAARDAGLPLSRRHQMTYLQNWDLGLGILAIALNHLGDDKPLARTSLARAGGKLFRLLGVS